MTKKILLFGLLNFGLITSLMASDVPGRMAQYYTQKYIEEEKAEGGSLTQQEIDSIYQSYLKPFKRQEEIFQKGKGQLGEHPLAKLSGGITYAMTLDEMKQKVKDKFKTMKNNGEIISKDEFKKIADDYFIPEKDHINLTRIWGVEYLKEKINKSNLSEIYDAPDYVVVADDPKNIKVNLQFTRFYPMINHIKNGAIYFKKIKDKPVGDKIEQNTLRGWGFTDFSGEGNIIQEESTGKNYIVDTEWKSFQPKMKGKWPGLLIYLTDKFKFLNEGLPRNYIVDIDL